MGLGSIIRGGVATAKTLLGGQDQVLDDVTVEFWIEDIDAAGQGRFSSPVSFQALVIRQQKTVMKSDGQEAVATTYVMFLEELTPQGTGNGRREPLDERDVITLSDGTTGPILTITGVMDQLNSTPYYAEVYLG